MLFDVVVLGAGVAGSAAAITLARKGFHVALAGNHAPISLDTAETLSSAAKPWLEHLGVWSDFQKIDALPVLASSHKWGNQNLSKTSLTSPYGNDWIIPKERFVGLMRQRAFNDGAKVISDQWDSVKPLNSNSSQAKYITLMRNGEALISRAVIDASGRSSAVARQFGSKLTQFSHQVAAVWHIDVIGAKNFRPWIHVASHQNGWVYAATSALGGYTISSYTNPRIKKNMKSQVLNWADDDQEIKAIVKVLENQLGISDLATRLNQESPVFRSAASSSLWPVSGDYWLAVGDAACSLDPLTSTGMLHALRSGSKGADALDVALKGDDGGLHTYSRMMRQFVANYSYERKMLYTAAGFDI